MTKRFADKRVYYSGSLTGTPEHDLQFPKKLVSYIESLGADVLDPHVAISPRLIGEREAYFAKQGTKYNISLDAWKELSSEEQDEARYKYFIGLLDEATHVVALLNGPTTGVGMEIEHAVLKPQLGLNETPILGLVHTDRLASVSPMIRGAAKVYPHFILKTYATLRDAEEIIYQFLEQD